MGSIISIFNNHTDFNIDRKVSKHKIKKYPRYDQHMHGVFLQMMNVLVYGTNTQKMINIYLKIVLKYWFSLV